MQTTQQRQPMQQRPPSRYRAAPTNRPAITNRPQPARTRTIAQPMHSVEGQAVEQEQSPQIPHNLLAEGAVIGACLLSRNAIRKARKIITPEMFYGPKYGAIFSLQCSLEQQGRGVDIISISEALQQCGMYEQCGGIEALRALTDRHNCPSRFRVADYAQIVLEKYRLRQIYGLGELLMRASCDGDAASARLLHTVLLKCKAIRDPLKP